VFEPYFDDLLACGGALAVRDRRNGRVAGVSRYEPRGDAVEIGWTFLVRELWGGEANGELKALMLGHAFASVDRVEFRVHGANLRSRRAVEKLGAELVAETADGLGRPMVVYELRRYTNAFSPVRARPIRSFWIWLVPS
jgi:RimJ/RimL family protein N-acetyltransferase